MLGSTPRLSFQKPQVNETHTTLDLFVLLKDEGTLTLSLPSQLFKIHGMFQASRIQRYIKEEGHGGIQPHPTSLFKDNICPSGKKYHSRFAPNHLQSNNES
jgi:hypothetical protein